MNNLNFHDLLTGILITVLSGSIIGIFNLNSSVIRLTEEIKGIKEVTNLQITSLDKRLTMLESSP